MLNRQSRQTLIEIKLMELFLYYCRKSQHSIQQGAYIAQQNGYVQDVDININNPADKTASK